MDKVQTRNDYLPRSGSEDDPASGERDRSVHRHGEANPEGWDEQKAVTGRPNDEVPENTTFAERAAKPAKKAVSQDSAENKAVSPAKAAAKRRK